MLQYMAAAHEIGSARVFGREVSADYLDAATPSLRPASWLTRIIAVTGIARAAKKAKEIAVAASNFDDALAVKSVAVDQSICRYLSILSVAARERQRILEAHIIVDLLLSESRVDDVTTIEAVTKVDVAARRIRRLTHRSAEAIAQGRNIGNRNQWVQ